MNSCRERFVLMQEKDLINKELINDPVHQLLETILVFHLLKYEDFPSSVL